MFITIHTTKRVRKILKIISAGCIQMLIVFIIFECSYADWHLNHNEENTNIFSSIRIRLTTLSKPISIT
jgi:hypothetical protein